MGIHSKKDMSGACEYIPQKHKHEIDEEEKGEESKSSDIIRLVTMATILISIAWLKIIPSEWLSDVVVLIAVVVGGYPIFKESFLALKKGRINMELSMVIAIIASLLLLQILPAIAITFFALLSEFIEEFIVEKGRKNIEILYRNAPKKAIIKENRITKDREQNENSSNNNVLLLNQLTKEVPVDQVKIGDIVVVREGDIIPIDGQILVGISTIDQSTITGESIPVEKNAGDSVFAGTINLTNKLEIMCKKISTDTTYAKIIHLVEESEASKAPIQKLSDKLATRLIQFAIGLSVITFIATQNLVSTLSVIVVAGACGLAVGTPIALLASNSKLAKKGIIVKGGIQIENIKNAGTIVFDKTGTLTEGSPKVTKIVSFYKVIEPKKILEYAALAERYVNHPLAKAIVEKAIEEKIDIKNIISNDNSDKYPNDNLDNHDRYKSNVCVGRGVSAFYNGHRISVGNSKFIEEQFRLIYNNKVENLSQIIDLNIPNRYDDGDDNDTLLLASTTVLVALDQEIIGVILLEDKLRSKAKEAISEIRSMGLQIIMLTGDNEKIAKRIANEVDIDKYYANLLPEDKVMIIKEIVNEKIVNEKQDPVKKRNRPTVIMVGDGINDAPALAEADVGIAMGKTGTDVAIETADVILMTEDLTKIPHLIKSSRRTLFTIQQNFFGTLFIDGLGFILAFAGFLNPLLAAIIHVSSELVFIVNSARLIKGNV